MQVIKMGVKQQQQQPQQQGVNDNDLAKNSLDESKTKKWYQFQAMTNNRAVVSKKYRMPPLSPPLQSQQQLLQQPPPYGERPHLTLFGIVLNFVIFMCLLCFLLMGAYSLTVTEQYEYGQQPHQLGHEHQHKNLVNDSLRLESELDAIRDRVIERIWEITVSLNILYRDNWTRLAAVELRDFQNRYTQLILNAHQQPQSPSLAPAVTTAPSTATTTNSLKVPSSSSSSSSTIISQQTPPTNNWQLSEAFLYCLLLLTTTGMPNISLTFGGKLMTTVFILLGVPLMILYLAMIGSLGSKCVRIMFCGRNSQHQSHQQQHSKQLAASITPPPITLIEKLKKTGGGGAAGTAARTATSGRVSEEIDVFSIPNPVNTIDSKLFCVNDIIGRDVQITNKPPIETTIAIASDNTQKKPAVKSRRKWHLNYLFGVLLFFSMYTGFLTVGYLILRTLNPEFWTFFECFYFSFLTLTTISFGSEEERMKIFEAGHKSDFVFWFCAGYVLTGLSLLSTFFYVINDEFLQFF